MHSRAVVRAGAFAPVNFKQQVLSTRPEQEISHEVTSNCKNFLRNLDLSNDSTKTISFNPTVLLKKGAEWWKMFNLLEGRRGNYPTLHPSCEGPNDAPDQLS